MEDKMIIYRALNLVNGKSYIGKSEESTLNKRKAQHIRCSSNPCYMFHFALRKYGIDYWEWSVLEELDDSKSLIEAEVRWIEKHRSYIGFPDCHGYNMTLGGEGGAANKDHPNKVTIYEKISRGNAGKNHFLNKMSEDDREMFLDKHRRGVNNPSHGKPRTKLQLDAIRKTGMSCKGRILSEETKRKMRESGKGKITGERNPNFGKKGSAHHGSKSLVIIYPDGKEVLTKCITEFAEAHGLQYQNLGAVAKGKHSQHKGFKAREYSIETDRSIEIWEGDTLLKQETHSLQTVHPAASL
jgi:group I intron endonuclease